MAEVDVEYLGRLIGVLIDGQREIRSRLVEIDGHLTAIEYKLADTATCCCASSAASMGQVRVGGIRVELLREPLEARIRATEAPLNALEAGG